jgi:hypothetical protein
MARRIERAQPAQSGGLTDARLAELFDDAQRFAAGDVAAAHRLVRIRWREGMVQAAVQKGELKLANDILDSIAKDSGDARHKHEAEPNREAAIDARERLFKRLDDLRQRLARRAVDPAGAGGTDRAAR